MNKYEFKGTLPLKTKTGVEAAKDFVQIVHGGRGAYVEIADEDIIREALNFIKARHIYYGEYRTADDVKFYYQRRLVKYADYKIGYWYASPADLQGFEIVGKYKEGK